jgi:hypothetical protein
LNTKLIPVSGRKGSEAYYAERPASIPGFFFYEDQLWLEFRGGRLTGWTNDWRRKGLW